jgi:hypothetical protein
VGRAQTNPWIDAQEARLLGPPADRVSIDELRKRVHFDDLLARDVKQAWTVSPTIRSRR